MAETPSKRRRKGREAFDPGVDPMNIQPYSMNSYYFASNLADWLDGWGEAEEAYEAKQKELEQKELDDDYVCEKCGQPLPDHPDFIRR